jgi:hypothetical protein
MTHLTAAAINGPCHVSGIFLPLRVKSLPLATIYEVKIPLRKWKKSLLQRNPAQMTSANASSQLQPESRNSGNNRATKLISEPNIL